MNIYLNLQSAYDLKTEEFLRAIEEMGRKREPFAIATVVRVEGSSLGKPGFKILMDKEGKVLAGTLGGVCPESAIVQVGLETINKREPKIVRVFLEDAGRNLQAMVKSREGNEIHVETNCGGVMDIYVEPFLPSERLVLIGQGGKDDVEDMLVKMGKLLDFEVVVVDHAPLLSEKPDRLIAEADFDLKNFDFQPTDSVIVLTKGERDLPVLSSILSSNSKVRFIGLLASRKRAAEDLKKLEEAGFTKEDIESIHTPVGIDIGAVTPAEIALSIMSDVIATKYRKHLPHKS